MGKVIDFNDEVEKRKHAHNRARELVSDMEEQARPHIQIAEWLQIKALEKPFAEVLLEIEQAQEEEHKRWLASLE